MNGPIFVQLLQPPPVVAQVGEQNTIAGGSGFNLLFKTLQDVDGPFTMTQDGWIVSYIGSTQHVHLINPATLPVGAHSLGSHTNVNTSVDAAANNDFLVYDSGTSKWHNLTLAGVQALLAGGASTPAFDALSNVNFAGKATGAIPYWNGTTWVQQGIGAFFSGSPTNGYVLTSVLGVPTWQPAAVGGGGGTGTGAPSGSLYLCGGARVVAGTSHAPAGWSSLGFVDYATLNVCQKVTPAVGGGGGSDVKFMFAIPAGSGIVAAKLIVTNATAGTTYTWWPVVGGGWASSTYQTWTADSQGNVVTNIFPVTGGDQVGVYEAHNAPDQAGFQEPGRTYAGIVTPTFRGSNATNPVCMSIELYKVAP